MKLSDKAIELSQKLMKKDLSISDCFNIAKESSDILMKCAAYIKLSEFVIKEMNDVDNDWEGMEKEIRGYNK